MTLINTENIEEAKKLIKKSGRPIIVKSQGINFNRKILEYGKFNTLLLSLGIKARQSLRHLDSGFDYVMAKLAAKNNISIGIDLNEIKKLDKKEKAVALSKIKQNLDICKKAKAKIKVTNYKDKRDSFSILLSLGASTSQASEAFD